MSEAKKSTPDKKRKKDVLKVTELSVVSNALERQKKSSAFLFRFFVNSVYIKEMEPKVAITKILKMNKLEGDFQVIQRDKNSPNGVFCEMEAKGKLIQALCTKKRLRAPNCRIILNKRIRKLISEKEFIESSKKFDNDE